MKTKLLKIGAEKGCCIDCRDCKFSPDRLDSCELSDLYGVDSPEIKARFQKALDKKNARKEAKKKEVESITVYGEVYSIGDQFEWIDENGYHKKGDIRTIKEVHDGYVIFEECGKYWLPWIKSCWKRVTKEPVWNSEFEFGKTYKCTSGDVVLCTHEGNAEWFAGTVVIPSAYSIGYHTRAWRKSAFKPCKIKVIEE